MPMEEDPIVGAFYEGPQIQQFEVIAFDENEGVAQILYADGTVEDLDMDTWYGLDLEQIESPTGENDEDKENADERPEEDDEDDDCDEDEEEDE